MILLEAPGFEAGASTAIKALGTLAPYGPPASLHICTETLVVFPGLLSTTWEHHPTHFLQTQDNTQGW